MKDRSRRPGIAGMSHPSITPLSRRRFLATTGAFAAGTALLRGQQAAGANEQVRIGLIGCGSRGSSLSKQLMHEPMARIVAVCDPDTDHMARLAAMVGNAPQQIRDYRKLLERPDIDAVVIASPNHWHALHTIHACQAGKDVYVEKPASHDVWSGGQMVAAAAKYGRVVQAGTQNRSDVGLIAARDAIHRGEFGAIRSIRGLCIRNRESIGKVAQPIHPPASLDYDLWLGPAMDEPIFRTQLHYDWHWVYNTGNGDIGNQGPHELDLISWFLGDPEMPKEVFSYGGRFGWNDAGETANLQVATYELGGVPCCFEVNNLWLTPERNVEQHYKGIRVGIVVTCEHGEFRGGRGGGFVLANDGQTKLAKFPGDAGAGHMRNFLEVVKSRRLQDLRAPLAPSHHSVATAHFANASLRTGAQVPLAELRQSLPQTEVYAELIDRQFAQLKNWNLDFNKTLCHVGSKLAIDPTNGMIMETNPAAAFNRPVYRTGYEVPEIA